LRQSFWAHYEPKGGVQKLTSKPTRSIAAGRSQKLEGPTYRIKAHRDGQG
jgi:hypothetical protein